MTDLVLSRQDKSTNPDTISSFECPLNTSDVEVRAETNDYCASKNGHSHPTHSQPRPLPRNSQADDDDGIRIIPDSTHIQDDNDGIRIIPVSPIDDVDFHGTRAIPESGSAISSVERTSPEPGIRIRWRISSESSSSPRRDKNGLRWKLPAERKDRGPNRERDRRLLYLLRGYERRRKNLEDPTSWSPELVNMPFFKWRVKRGMTFETHAFTAQECEENILRILSKVKESISSSDSGLGALVANAFRCTAQDLSLRHADFMATVKQDEIAQNNDVDRRRRPSSMEVDFTGRDDSEQQGHVEGGSAIEYVKNVAQHERVCVWLNSHGQKPRVHAEPVEEQPEEHSHLTSHHITTASDPGGLSSVATLSTRSPDPKLESPIATEIKDEAPAQPMPVEGRPPFPEQQHDRPGLRSRRSAERPSSEFLIKKRLLTESQRIFWAFFPKPGDSCYVQSHAVCEIFWGALDDIFRVGRSRFTIFEA